MALRRTPLRRGTKPLARRKPLPSCNRDRKARLRAEQFGPQAEWIRTMCCATCRAPAPSEPSHVKTRGAGGGRRDQIPQCSRCHAEMGAVGIKTFEAEHGYNLAGGAAVYARGWDAMPEAEKDHWRKLFRERWPDAARYLDKNGGW